MRRLSAVLTALATLAAAVCVSCSPSGGAKELNVVLVNTPWARAITKHIGEFEKQTGIKVKLQQYSQEQARDRVFVSLTSKTSDLDVFNLLPSNEGSKWEHIGALQDLSGYLRDAPRSYEGGDLLPSALQASRLNGKLVGIPVNVEGPVVYYRKDLLKKYGVATPRTVDELATAATTINRKSGGHYVTATRGLAPTLTYTFGNVLHNEGLQWTGDDGKPTFDDPRAVRAIDSYVRLAGDAGPKGVVNNGPVQNSALMASGRAAFMIDSSNELDSVAGDASKVGDKLGVMPIPKGPGGSHPTVLSWNLGVSKYSERKANAWKFIQWSTSPEIVDKLAADGVAPPRGAPWRDPGFRSKYEKPAEREWLDSVRTIVDTGTGEVGPPARDQDTARRIIGEEIDRAILGKATPRQAAATIQDGLAPLVSEHARPGG